MNESLRQEALSHKYSNKVAIIFHLEEKSSCTWQGTCITCGILYEEPEKSVSNPYPQGVFCPECKRRGLFPPGIIDFHQLKTTEMWAVFNNARDLIDIVAADKVLETAARAASSIPTHGAAVDISVSTPSIVTDKSLEELGL